MMMQNRFAQQISQALQGKRTESEIVSLLEKPKRKELGDLAFPCFTLARDLRRSPQQIAAELAEQLQHNQWAEVKATGPYVNLFLDRVNTSQLILDQIAVEGHAYGQNDDGDGRNITLDLSSPNIAKPFSMGHLRSTVIGNAIANIAEKNGYQPIRINHLGDWGTQFGKLIVAYQHWGEEQKVIENPIEELLKLYIRFHEEAKSHPKLEDEGRRMFKMLEDGDEKITQLWRWFRNESLKEFQRIYQLLNITFDYYQGESFYNDKMQAVIDDLAQKGILEESDGAKIVSLGEDTPPCLIQRSDGATLYATRDLATAIYRKEQFDFAQSLYIVGYEQSLHFQQLIDVLIKAGYPWATEMKHISFGMILQNGKKMSTRKGRLVKLEEVLEEAIQKTESIIAEKNPQLAQRQEIAQQVGVGAVIFHDLKHFRNHDVEFQLDSMLQFDGETGPYLQYTHARCCSILRKAEFQQPIQGLSLAEEAAWPIISLLGEFPHLIRQAFHQYDPSRIARYVLELARNFNQYYAHVKIVDHSAEQPARLNLVYAISVVIAESLRLLGIKAPTQM